MASMAATPQLSLSEVPARLIRFFAKYPPKQYSALYTGITIPLTRVSKKERQALESSQTATSSSAPPVTPITPSEDPNVSNVEPETTMPPHTPVLAPRNPFLPWKNHATGHWQSPRFGLREQADLVKMAKIHGLEPLLPPSRKSTAFKEQRALEKGLRIRGTGEGQKVKGHKWERQMGVTVEKRRKAMEDMPEMIRLWKQRGHGRGWKKYPK